MLVLTRKVDEKVRICDDAEITVVRVDKGTVMIGIEAPKHIRIKRSNLA